MTDLATFVVHRQHFSSLPGSGLLGGKSVMSPTSLCAALPPPKEDQQVPKTCPSCSLGPIMVVAMQSENSEHVEYDFSHMNLILSFYQSSNDTT